MAANKKKKKTTAKSRRKKQAQQASIRCEILALCLLLLAFFSVLGLFWRKSLIGFLRDVEQGLFGTGFYILPVINVWAAVVLLRERKKPPVARILVTAALAPLLGAIVQVFSKQPIVWGSGLIPALYRAGVAGSAGGVISGVIGAGLAACVSKVGAAVLLFLLMLGCLMAPLGMTPRSLILAIRNRPRMEEKEPEPQADMAERIVNHIAENRIAREREREAARKLPREDFDVDLPVDDPPLAPKQPEEPAAVQTEEPDETPVRAEEEPAPRQLTIEELPEQREDAMPLPLITDLIEKKKKVAPATELPVYLEEPEEQEPEESEVPLEMPVFDPSIYCGTHAEPAESEEAPAEELPWEMEPSEEERAEPEDAEDSEDDAALLPEMEDDPEEEELPEAEPPQTVSPAPAPQASSTISADGAEAPVYIYPPLSLLDAPAGGAIDATEEMRLNAERLSDALRSFGIQPNIVNVTRGPTVTRYELQLNRGVKLSKITNLSEDIALSLGATGVRISAIPEKISVVGIEVPNHAVSTVYIREVLDSREFRTSKSSISFAVGKDIGGNRIIGNIAKLPHLLIAGTTGSGKSVCMNSLIISLLYKSTPEEVRLIMIDPKMVELGVYNGIPHLLIPVVTDPKKASGSLQWAVSEMMRRYSIMAESGARDIASYNKIIANNPERTKLPQIVVVIDELADLMLVAAKEVEESICRVAQMGRAAGIHLVIATQRPSSNVITGLMKANIPSRIAFAVASAMESRIILDTGGAEKLVGHGDMLYAPLGEGKAKRIQGCYISDEEVQRVADFVKQSGKADYSSELLEQIERGAAQGGKPGSAADSGDPEDDRDELLYDAIDTILDMGQASVSVLQRKLKLGYARASRIVDQMEEMGVVGPHKGSKPRDILITKEKWEAVKDGAAQLNEPVPDEL